MFHEICEICNVSISTAERSLLDNLNLRKKKNATRWITHLLTDLQKKQRVKYSKDSLKMFELSGPRRFCDVDRVDETRLFLYDVSSNWSNQMLGGC